MIKKIVRFFKKNKRHGINAYWSNLNQGANTISALILSVVFARFATKEIYGQYLFILALIGMFSIVSIPGVRTVIFRAIAQGYDGVYKEGTKFSFLWSLLGIPLIIITGIYFYIFKDEIVGICLISSALFFPFITSLQSWIPFLKGKSDFRKLAIRNSIKCSVHLIAIALAIILTKNISLIILIYLLVNSIFNIYYHFKSLKSLKNNELDKGWKKQSYALSIMDFSSLVFGKVDIILIGLLMPINQVAIYGLVMKFVNLFLMGIKSSIEVILPKLYKSKSVTIQYFYKYLFLSFLIPIILYSIIYYPITFLYGTKYLEVVKYSQIYLFAIPFYVLTSLSNVFLIKYRLDKEININKIMSIIFVILMYLILIPYLGIVGGVLSSILYFIFEAIINLYSLHKYFKKNKKGR